LPIRPRFAPQILCLTRFRALIFISRRFAERRAAADAAIISLFRDAMITDTMHYAAIMIYAAHAARFCVAAALMRVSMPRRRLTPFD